MTILPARPPRSRFTATPTRVRLAGLTALTLATLAVAGSSQADPVPSYVVARNTVSGATVTASAGGSHLLEEILGSVAADGTVHVAVAQVTPTRTATVLVNDGTGVGRLVGLDPDDPDSSTSSGDGGVIVRHGSDLTHLDVATGEAQALAAVPAADGGDVRTVTAVAATAAGAVVATVDVTEAGTSGQVHQARLWRVSPSSAEEIASVDDSYVPAVAVHGTDVDAVVVSAADDAVSRLHLAGTDPSMHPMGLTLQPDVFAAELGYATQGDSLTPLVTLMGSGGSSLYGADGTLLSTYPAGARVFVAATDINDPTSVSNPLAKRVRLTGVSDGDQVAYGTKVTPVVSATASGVVPTSPAPATLQVTSGKRVREGTSGRTVTLSKNTCFEASSAATLFTSAATPVEKCVSVAHRLDLLAFRNRTRKAVVGTTAEEVLVQVRRPHAWKTVRRVPVHSGEATFTAPDGSVRVVAPESDLNAATDLVVAR